MSEIYEKPQVTIVRNPKKYDDDDEPLPIVGERRPKRVSCKEYVKMKKNEGWSNHQIEIELYVRSNLDKDEIEKIVGGYL